MQRMITPARPVVGRLCLRTSRREAVL